MYNYDNLLVCLDLTILDDQLIKYAAYFASTVGSRKVSFIHVMKYRQLPDAIAQKFPDFNDSVENVIREEMDKKIGENFGEVENIEKEIILEEGNATEKILKVGQKIEADLLLVGKKTGFQGEGILPSKLVRMAHCSVLFVSESSPRKLNKILAPTDFSRPAQLAIEKAIKLSKAFEAEIICQHVYGMPKQYFPYMPEKNWQNKVLEEAQKNYKKFLEKIETPSVEIPCQFTFDDGEDETQKIYDNAVKEEADLIIVGSKGYSKAASALIGSIAEKLTRVKTNIPLLIIKDKKESSGILKTIFKALKID